MGVECSPSFVASAVIPLDFQLLTGVLDIHRLKSRESQMPGHIRKWVLHSQQIADCFVKQPAAICSNPRRSASLFRMVFQPKKCNLFYEKAWDGPWIILDMKPKLTAEKIQKNAAFP
jgi:hypothetical protein